MASKAQNAMAQSLIPYAGKVLDRETIVDLAQEYDKSLVNRGSIIPSDVDDYARDAEGHGLKSWKHDNPILLHRTGSGNYLILPTAERKYFVASGSASGPALTREERLKAARALIAAEDSKPIPVVKPVPLIPAVVAGANKGNGAAIVTSK
jgi:hypothetical protein